MTRKLEKPPGPRIPSGWPHPADSGLPRPTCLHLRWIDAFLASQSAAQFDQALGGGVAWADAVHQRSVPSILIGQRLDQPTDAGATALERTSPSIGCFTDTEVMAMKRPHCCRCITGSASLAKWTVLIRFRSAAARQSSMLVSAKLLDGGVPAFTAQISRRPKRSTTATRSFDFQVHA
jgi:hypothetical protein